jgi:tryptophanyl-tRNA synthetase
LADGKKRVVSGMRPTGRLHIGHYFGALQNWVKLQKNPEYECFYFIADWHALTSDYANTSAISQNVVDIATDFLAAGVDPKKSVIFLQSLVPEHAELHLLLSMVTPLGWLERVPTYKEQLENITDKDLHMYGFLGYPVLQTADIVMYGEEGKPLIVPVGEDQVSHVELSREIVRKFNLHNVVLDAEELRKPENRMAVEILLGSFAGKTGGTQVSSGFLTDEQVHNIQSLVRRRIAEVGLNNFFENLKRSTTGDMETDAYREHIQYLRDFKESHNVFRKFVREVLSEPEWMLTPTPRIPGTDGRKMSKSYRNDISLSETDEEIRKKTKVMKTDPARQRRTDKGDPDKCPVYDWHKLFSAEEQGRLEWVQHGCRTAEIGCTECKAAMADNLIKWIAPIREERLYYERRKALVRRIIRDGSAEARDFARRTMSRIRDAVFGKQRILRPLGPRLRRHRAGKS